MDLAHPDMGIASCSAAAAAGHNSMAVVEEVHHTRPAAEGDSLYTAVTDWTDTEGHCTVVVVVIAANTEIAGCFRHSRTARKTRKAIRQSTDHEVEDTVHSIVVAVADIHRTAVAAASLRCEPRSSRSSLPFLDGRLCSHS